MCFFSRFGGAGSFHSRGKSVASSKTRWRTDSSSNIRSWSRRRSRKACKLRFHSLSRTSATSRFPGSTSMKRRLASSAASRLRCTDCSGKAAISSSRACISAWTRDLQRHGRDKTEEKLADCPVDRDGRTWMGSAVCGADRFHHCMHIGHGTGASRRDTARSGCGRRRRTRRYPGAERPPAKMSWRCPPGFGRSAVPMGCSPGVGHAASPVSSRIP